MIQSIIEKYKDRITVGTKGFYKYNLYRANRKEIRFSFAR